MLSRRTLLAASAAAVVTPTARAAPAARDRKFLFVFAAGGWDTTRVFAPEFHNPNVDLEPDAEPLTIGNLSIVDHPSRPAVRTFFERYFARSLLLDGILVPSVAHEVCTRLMLSGAARGRPDLGAVLAAARSADFVLPELIVEGPSFPDALVGITARTGSQGQLDRLLDDSLVLQSAAATRTISLSAQAKADAWVAAAAASAPAHAEGLDRASRLKAARDTISFRSDGTFAGRIQVAVDAFAAGLCRTATIAVPNLAIYWDTHADNDTGQSRLFEDTFSGLITLAELLDTTPGVTGAPLSEEVVVVVCSEMGRTPQLNSAQGKDHWPYTSALWWGPGISGDRHIGDYDDGFQGMSVDPASGEVYAGAPELSAATLAATLLTLGDLEPDGSLAGVTPLQVG